MPILVALVLILTQPADPFARWEKDIVALEKRLADKPPAKGGIVFAGSSSIRLWDLAKSFPDRPGVNVGFGGSTIPDSTHFAPRILLPHEPATIVFYAGDNDLANKRTPTQVRDDFVAFTKAIHAKLPKTRILFVAVKPSLARWTLYPVQQEANRLVQAACDQDPRLGFVDIVLAMLGPDGKPRAELFVKDGLHLSPKGYEQWTQTVNEALGPVRK